MAGGEPRLAPSSTGVAPAPDIAPGDVIGGRYQVRAVAQGGLGRVYICDQFGAACDRGDSRCALKTPIPSLLAQDDVLDSFVDEAVNWISLPPHPNIVMAYGVELHARLPYIVMQYVEGGETLADAIEKGEHRWQLALRAGIGIARGLAHAQEAGRLSHGDLKPANVMVTPAGASKVTDFGFSKSLVSGRGVREGWVVGTQGYMAPELSSGSPMPSQAADIYAFGVTLFECATGQSADVPEMYWALPPSVIESLAPGMPAGLAQVIAQCLQRPANARPSSFASILERLQMVHAAVTGAPAPPDAVPDLPASADALRNAAQSWLNVGEWNKARALAEQAIAQDPGGWRAHNALGLVHREAGEHQAALESFRRAHAIDAAEMMPVANAALSAGDLGDRDEAGRLLMAALERVAMTGAWGQMDGASSLIAELFAPDEAIELLDRVLAANPRAAITWNNRAIVLRRAHRPAEALESAKQALAVNPAYAKAWSNRATAEVELSRWHDAIASADQAIALDPLLSGPYLAKATALAQSGRVADARASIARALALKPGDAQLQRAQALFNT